MENIQKWRFWFRNFWKFFETFFRPRNLKAEHLSKEFNSSICAYIVFYLPIFSRIEGGGVESNPNPPVLMATKKRGSYGLWDFDVSLTTSVYRKIIYIWCFLLHTSIDHVYKRGWLVVFLRFIQYQGWGQTFILTAVISL